MTVFHRITENQVLDLHEFWLKRTRCYRLSEFSDYGVLSHPILSVPIDLVFYKKETTVYRVT